jgi:hypothetical protein
MKVKLPVYEMLIDDKLSSDLEIDFIALVDSPAIKRPFFKFQDENVDGAKVKIIVCKECDHTWEYAEGGENPYKCNMCGYDNKPIERKSFAIQNEEQRIISGPLMIPNQKIYRYDKETETEYEVYFSPETIKKIAIKYAKRGFQKNVNIMHNPEMVASGVTLFEIFQSDKSRGIKPMEGFEDLPDGTLFGSMYVENDVAWDMVKNDIVKGFSVEGNFGMKLKSKYEMQFEKIVEILNSVK